MMRFETRELASPVFPRGLAEAPHGTRQECNGNTQPTHDTRECPGNTQGDTQENIRKKSTVCPEPALGRTGFEMLRRQLRSTLS
jgi:hypothetical protein